MEAMVTGLPVIGTGWSGNTEFMDADNSYLVDSKVVDVSEEAAAETPVFRGHRWAEPSVDHLRELMRCVFQDRDEARRRGEIARASVVERFDLPTVAATVMQRLKLHAG